MNQVNELIERIELVLLKSVLDEDWQEIVFEASLLVGLAEFTSYFKHGPTSKMFAPEVNT